MLVLFCVVFLFQNFKINLLAIHDSNLLYITMIQLTKDMLC
uniref:FERM domain-containing protein n=1 Tax=Siphoviridae sp. ctX581 TaxID=2826365 RepID=A0A8S5MDM3_9CAUD|nr:MAG TPA: hypothetical protein [Siphoviridae sp. ctX581]DAX31939.1 MAG TPA: hypothetical protein [Caudoviricetes sp.]